MSRQVMLTTLDNPYDPFDQFDDWRAYDEASGYYTSGLLARVAITSDELSDVDQLEAIEDAIDEIVRENYLGIYRKLVRDS